MDYCLKLRSLRLIHRLLDNTDNRREDGTANCRGTGVTGKLATLAVAENRLEDAEYRRQLAAANAADDSSNRFHNSAQIHILEQSTDRVATDRATQQLDNDWNKLFHRMTP